MSGEPPTPHLVGGGSVGVARDGAGRSEGKPWSREVSGKREGGCLVAGRVEGRPGQSQDC